LTIGVNLGNKILSPENGLHLLEAAPVASPAASPSLILELSSNKLWLWPTVVAGEAYLSPWPYSLNAAEDPPSGKWVVFSITLGRTAPSRESLEGKSCLNSDPEFLGASRWEERGRLALLYLIPGVQCMGEGLPGIQPYRYDS